MNPGINNEIVREHMEALFGVGNADAMRAKLSSLDPDEREVLVLEELSESLLRAGAAYVLPFTFKNESGKRTSHHLILATKNFTGYEIMKEIMAKESTDSDQGVPSFQYCLASERYPKLFELSRPLDDLEGMLLSEFSGKQMAMKDIYESHSIGRPYIKANYKRVLAKLEAAGTIICEPSAGSRPKRKGEVTFGDNVVVKFPPGAQT